MIEHCSGGIADNFGDQSCLTVYCLQVDDFPLHVDSTLFVASMVSFVANSISNILFFRSLEHAQSMSAILMSEA